MEMTLDGNFFLVDETKLSQLNGGGWKAALSAFGGTIAVAFTPVGCILGGAGVGAAMFGFGCAALDYACDNPKK